MTEYPEHEKLVEISDQSQAIGEFMEWLESTAFAVHDIYTMNDKIQEILADYFDIDLAKISEEKDQMIEEYRSAKVGCKFCRFSVNG